MLLTSGICKLASVEQTCGMLKTPLKLSVIFPTYNRSGEEPWFKTEVLFSTTMSYRQSERCSSVSGT